MKPEANADILYADIIDRQYQPSVVHRHMSMKGRAAQFAPFAALHGHSESIDEAARHTDTDTELTDENRTDIARYVFSVIFVFMYAYVKMLFMFLSVLQVDAFGEDVAYRSKGNGCAVV